MKLKYIYSIVGYSGGTGVSVCSGTAWRSTWDVCPPKWQFRASYVHNLSL